MRLFLNAEDTSMEPELLEAHSTPAYVEEVIRSSHRVQHSESTTVLGHSVKMFISQCTYFRHTEYYILRIDSSPVYPRVHIFATLNIIYYIILYRFFTCLSSGTAPDSRSRRSCCSRFVSVCIINRLYRCIMGV